MPLFSKKNPQQTFYNIHSATTGRVPQTVSFEEEYGSEAKEYTNYYCFIIESKTLDKLNFYQSSFMKKNREAWQPAREVTIFLYSKQTRAV